ncbi:TrbG/VirB9 family P-type conjugative transfer protein [Phenylobacterium terrae]|uniref:TrbG/VirB9 family P-type conjugative transfer protein n=1 Tax=Phenylobacterium terrae TaxID=2665495 RepID=A0ABW4NAC4_9CAUL
MDPGRRLTLAAALALAGCASTPDAPEGPRAAPAAAPSVSAQAALPAGYGVMAPIPNPPEQTPRIASADRPQARRRAAPAPASGRSAIAAANAQAREASRADSFVGGMQVFAYAPGRVFEVWTAPLRVTTLTLGPGETVIAKAAGDTVRWQIGETASGEGAAQRAHVLIKPLDAGLETNLVVTTNQRVYLVQLKSGPPESFNAAVAWDLGALAPPAAVVNEPPAADPLVTPDGPLEARYRISPQGRRPRWTPTGVVSDGTRTFIAFPPDLQADEAPALFVIAPSGEAQMVNYRQQGGLMVVDRVFDRAELRLGDRRPQVVRITRLAGGRT